ncbi:Zim17-type zinc finger protein [Thalictrum thalictroides]|uniref:Zim17-type zinc finger protein n=1 Tax=Thalictrum thalictroides TaxID=46969 RepID=A0A7J6VUI5_THATH|nr:Zim17-type zinc finger protein [Thalictrum thalictroides]
MATNTVIASFNSISTLSSSQTIKPQNKNVVFFRPNNSSCKLVTHQRVVFAPKVSKFRRAFIANLDYIEGEPSTLIKDNTIDIQLPRRSLLVQFTCNGCGDRTKRLINRNAYERGTVFVQCAGCLKHHKLVDNLNLVVEYNLLEDSNADSNDSGSYAGVR